MLIGQLVFACQLVSSRCHDMTHTVISFAFKGPLTPNFALATAMRDFDLTGRSVYIGLFKCNEAEAIADAQCNKTLDSEYMCYSPTENHSSKVRIYSLACSEGSNNDKTFLLHTWCVYIHKCMCSV